MPELVGDGEDVVITKHHWGAFYATDLDLKLRRRGIATIILGGISTNLGVESTARAAFDHGYEQIFVSDAMTAHEARDHEHTLRRILPLLGKVRSTRDVVSALTAQ